jgi:predicted nucleic acid-binding protein
VTLPLVLDAEGLDAICDPHPTPVIRALLREVLMRNREVLVPAVVCAEICRGVARTRRVETVVSRQGHGRWHAVRVVSTDFMLARQVGAVLHGAGAGSRDMVDAHVVAVCAVYGGGLVVTADEEDIQRLAAAVPSARVVTRQAR